MVIVSKKRKVILGVLLLGLLTSPLAHAAETLGTSGVKGPVTVVNGVDQLIEQKGYVLVI